MLAFWGAITVLDHLKNQYLIMCIKFRLRLIGVPYSVRVPFGHYIFLVIVCDESTRGLLYNLYFCSPLITNTNIASLQIRTSDESDTLPSHERQAQFSKQQTQFLFSQPVLI